MLSVFVLGAPAKQGSPTHEIKPVGHMELSATQCAAATRLPQLHSTPITDTDTHHDMCPHSRPANSPRRLKMYQYWNARAENGENAKGMAAFTPVLPKSHKALNLVQTQYDLPSYISPGEPCLPWCMVDIEVDAAAAAAAGRVTFPPDNIATWYAPTLFHPRRPAASPLCHPSRPICSPR
tara:strand:+ start:162 stop:701 length:540 start_codon:yes stop_codon:yes gene_type:complete